MRAEITFTEVPSGGAWLARLVARELVRDTRYVPLKRGGERVKRDWHLSIVHRGANAYEVFHRFGGRGSERRDTFQTLDAAQAWAMNAVGNRFKVVQEPA